MIGISVGRTYAVLIERPECKQQNRRPGTAEQFGKDLHTVNSSERVLPKSPDELEIQTEESTMGRFNNLLGRLLGVNRTEVRAAEEAYKKERRKKRAAKRNAEKG
jgi:hypothetical protein